MTAGSEVLDLTPALRQSIAHRIADLRAKAQTELVVADALIEDAEAHRLNSVRAEHQADELADKLRGMDS